MPAQPSCCCSHHASPCRGSLQVILATSNSSKCLPSATFSSMTSTGCDTLKGGFSRSMG